MPSSSNQNLSPLSASHPFPLPPCSRARLFQGSSPTEQGTSPITSWSPVGIEDKRTEDRGRRQWRHMGSGRWLGKERGSFVVIKRAAPLFLSRITVYYYRLSSSFAV